MAIVGCSYLKYAKYAYSQGAVSYSDGGTAAKLVNVNISLDSSSDNDFYADNALDETDKVFAGGTLTVNTNDLTDAVSKVLLGLQDASLETISGITDSSVKELFFDDRQVTPAHGIGLIIKHQRSGAAAWTAVILPRVQFSVPSEAAETQGKQISWQTPELSGTIMRDETTYRCWKKQATFSTEAQAILYINNRLSISA